MSLPERFPVLLNGRWKDAAEATLPMDDLGFTMGVTLVERLRTYRHQLPLLGPHLQRLQQGLRLLGIESVKLAQLHQHAHLVVQENVKRIQPADDLSVGIVVTPGGPTQGHPTVLVTGQRIKWTSYREEFLNGVSLQTVKTCEVPSECIPRNVKHRSRMHYYLADREARAINPGSRALLLNLRQEVAESTVGSVVACFGDTLVAPPTDQALNGVTLNVLQESLVSQQGSAWRFSRRSLTKEGLLGADAVFWLNATVGILQVSTIDLEPCNICQRTYQALLNCWQGTTGVDVRQQFLATR